MRHSAVVLAAGQGTRMHSDRPKVLHRLAGCPMLEHVYALAASLGCDPILIVYGHHGERVRTELAHLAVHWIEQTPQLGTGHAVMQAAPHLAEEGLTLILYGDVPLLRPETITRLLAAGAEHDLALLTTRLDDPHGYGRILRDAHGQLLRIVEELDAEPQERAICEVNTGILCVANRCLKDWLSRIDNRNAKGEYYLTDIIGLAVADGARVTTIQAGDAGETQGVNSRVQLARLERQMQLRQAEELLHRGVTLLDPQRFDLRGKIAELGRDVEIDVNVILEGTIRLGSRIRIGAGSILRNVTVGDGVEILPYSVVDGAEIGAGARIGPYARIRPETVLGQGAHVGNFVEIKKSTIGAGSKVNHLSYVGDTTVGEAVNIGAGTITCNYDGANKHQTVIEDGAFIGSDTQLVAPVRIGRNATIGAGSTITRDAPAEQLTLSRCKQLSLVGWQRPKKKE